MSAPRLLGDLVPAGLNLPDGSHDLVIKGLALDSRAVRPGFLFAALPGVTTHGNAFIKAAVEAGAAVVLAERGTTAAVPVIEADDPRLALAQIAARFFTPPAGLYRRHYRHQWQKLDRGIPAPDLGPCRA